MSTVAELTPWWCARCADTWPAERLVDVAGQRVCPSCAELAHREWLGK